VSFKIWLKALRLPFLTATLVPVVLGSTVAWHTEGTFSWFYFFLTLLGISFIHTATNLTNDYFDHRTKNDEFNLDPTPFSGGSRVIQDGLIPAKSILSAAMLCFAIGSIIGLYLNLRLDGNIILFMGVTGILIGFYYTAGPLRIGYRGIGEFIVGFCFGPLVVMGSYYVQANAFSLYPLLASIPVGILILLVLYINEFPDRDADKAVNKRTLVVILGKERAMKIYNLLLASVYLYIIILSILHLLPFYTLIILLTAPMAFSAYSVSKKNFNRIRELLPANAMTIGLHLTIGLLISAGFILDRVF